MLTLGVLIHLSNLRARLAIHGFIIASWLLASTLKKTYCALPNSEHTLEKKQVLNGQSLNSSGQKNKIPDSFLSPPPSLLEEFSTRYHLWTRSSKTPREHTSQNPNLCYYFSFFIQCPKNKLSRCLLVLSSVCGSCCLAGTCCHPRKDTTGSQYLRALRKRHLQSNSTLRCLLG